MSIPDPRPSDADRFDAAFRATVLSARRYAWHLVGPDIAEDVVAEAFAVVWTRRDRLPPTEDEQRAWVIGVVRRCALAMARRERRRRGLDERTPEPTVRDHADTVVGWDRARRLMDELPAHESEAVVLTVWIGLTAREAAHTVDVTEGAFRKRLTRARQHLARMVEAENRAEEADHAR